MTQSDEFASTTSTVHITISNVFFDVLKGFHGSSYQELPTQAGDLIPRHHADYWCLNQLIIGVSTKGAFVTIQHEFGFINDTGTMIRVFANGPGDRSSHTKDTKMVLDASLLNTQHYKVWIKGKVEQSRERSSALRYTSV